jgi:autotransporter-associated beta strand protein
MAPFSWSRWLRSLVRPPVKAYRRPRRSRTLLLERLETRLAPATFVWTGAKDLKWSTPGNWAGNVAPSGNLDDLVFPALAGQKGNITTVDDLVGNGNGDPTFNSITIAASYTLIGNSEITLANPSGSGSVIVSAGAAGVVIKIPLNLAATSNGQFFTVNNGADLTVTGAVSGPSGSELAKDGAGILILTHDNSGFEGTVAVVPNGGILQIQNANALGDPSSSLTTTVGTNGQLQVNNLPVKNATVMENLVLNGPGVKADGAVLNVAGKNTWAGSVTLDSDVTFGSSAGELRITGVIGDLGAGHSVVKEGFGIVTFASADSYRGTTTVNNGILRIQNSFALGVGDGTPATAAIVNETANASGTVVTSGTLQLDDPTGVGFTVDNHLLTLNGFGGLTAATGIGALDNFRGANTWTGNITFGTPQPSVFDVFIGAQIPDPAYTLTLTGLISQPPTSTYTFTKVGLGTVILTHPNIYTGNTVVAAGILEITDSQALGFSPLCTVEVGATLELSIQNKTTDSTTGLANELQVTTPLNIDGLGFSNLGALFSQSGINTYSGTITLVDLDAADFPGPPSNPDTAGSDIDDDAGIGVAGDPNQSNGPSYFANDFSLTITGSIIGSQIPTPNLFPMRLDKLDTGNLILPNANLSLTSPIDIRQGWITAQNNNSLGVHINGPKDQRPGVPQPAPSLGDTQQPTVTVEIGAALHLDPLSGNLTIPQNLVLAGQGFKHVFGKLNHQGAVENLAGINTLTGNVVLQGQVGIGVENVFGVPSQLTMTGSVSETKPSLTVSANASGGSAEDDNIIETGSTSGTVTVNYQMYYIPDSLDIYYGIKGQPGSKLIASTNGKVSGSGTLVANYGPGPFTQIEIIVDAGGGLSGTVWTYTATVNPAGARGGVTKLGSQRLILQGDGTYTGPVDVKQGVLLNQNDTGLGIGNLPTSSTTVESGAALELASTNPKTNGGLQAGLGIWGNHLILNGSGNSAFGDGALTVLSPSDPYGPVNDPIVSSDDMWRGPVTLTSSASIQVEPNSRLTLFGSIDDATNKAPEGSDLTFTGGGGLDLAAAGTYRGVTNVTAGALTLQNGLALGGSPIAAQQVLTITGAKAGTTQFSLSFGSSTTPPITYTFSDADATNIQKALNALPSITSLGGVVSVTGGGTTFTITLAGNLTGFHQPKLVANLVTGPGTLNVGTLQDGSGGVVVANKASVQLQGGITVAGKPIIVQGSGLPVTPNTPLQWFNIGPAPEATAQTAGNLNVSGRVTGMAVDPNDPKVIYIATAGGGAWKTLNGGQTWIQMFDASYAMFGGAIAVAPSDPRVLYYGTGEADNSGDSYAGTGLYVSTDSGHSWSLVAGVNAPVNPLLGLSVSKIAVDYHNPSLVYVATSDLQINGEARSGLPSTVGIWRFDGAHWLNMTSIVSLARNPATAPKKGAPNTPGPDDDYRLSFPQSQATWSDLYLAKSDDPFTGLTHGVLFAALGTEFQLSTGVADPANGVYFSPNPAAPSPIWDIGNQVVDGEASTEFPTNKVTYGGLPPIFWPQGTIKITEFTTDTFFTGTTVLASETMTIFASIAYPDEYPLPPVPPNPETNAAELFQIQKAIATTFIFPFAGDFLVPPAYKEIANEPPKRNDPGDGFPETVLGEQGNYDQTIFTPDGVQLYIGGSEIDPGTHAYHVLFSPSGGSAADWTDISVDSKGNGPHTDDHALTMDAAGHILLGSDGGVWLWDPKTSLWSDLNGAGPIGGLETNTANSVAVDPNNLSIAYEGSQDNGLSIFTGSKTWTFSDFGDGGQVAVDPLNPNVVYHVRNGALMKTTAGAATLPGGWTTVLIVPDTLYFPFALDTVNPQRLVVGGVFDPFNFPPGVAVAVKESNDGGVTWHDLGAPYAPFDAVRSVAIAQQQGTFAFDAGFPLVTDIGTNTYDPKTIYTTDGSRVVVTKDRGATWVDRTSNLPAALVNGGTIAHITVDPTNRDTAYLVNDGPPDLSVGRVFITNDAGLNWEDITHNLPDVPVYTLAVDPRNNALYAGTDQGVYVSLDGGGTWNRLGAGLPFVSVRDLALNQNLNTLTAATYGRGIFQLFLSDIQAGAGGLTATSGNNVWSGPVLLSGPTSIGAEGTQQLQNGLSTASLNIVGTISDLVAGANNKLTKIGLGNVTFSGANTYGGVTEVAVGRLIVHNPKALSGSLTVVDFGAALQLQSSVIGEPLLLNGNGPSPGLNGHATGALENVSGNNTYSGPITLGGFVTIGVDTNSTLNITGSLTDNTHNFGIAKELTGTLILSAANTYGGGTAVNQGALNVQNALALGNPGTLTTVLDGAQLQLQGGVTVANEQLHLSGTGIVGTGAIEGVGGANDWQGPIVLSQDPGQHPTTTPPFAVAFGALLNSPGDSLMIEGTISQAAGLQMGLTKVGPGVVILNDVNNYDGPTTVAAGALRLRNGSALGTVINPAVVQTGAAIELDGDPGKTGGSIVVSGKSLTLNGNGTPEVQEVDVGGTAGSFTLTFNGQTTIALGFNVTAGQMQAALNNLSSVKIGGGFVTVVSGTPGVFLVTFGGGMAGAHQNVMTANPSGGAIASVKILRDGGAGALHDITGNDSWVAPVTLQSATSIGVDPGLQLTVSGPVRDPSPAPVPAASFSKVGAGTLVFPNVNTYTGKTLINQGVLNIQSGSTTIGSTPVSPLGAVVNEVQTVNVAGPATGLFSLTFTNNGASASTGPLPALISAADLQTALNKLSTIGGVGGSVTVTQSGSTFTVTFGGTLGGINLPQMTGAGLSGTVLTIKTVQDGSEDATVAAGATLQLQGGITISTVRLTLNGNGAGGVGALDSLSGANAWTLPIRLGSNTSIGADTDSTNTPSTLTLTGALSQVSAGTTLTKVGTGTLALAGSTGDTYTGLTTVAGGQLQLAKTGGALAVIGDLTVGNGTSAPGSEIAQLELSNQIAAGQTLTVKGDGVFDLNGQQQTVGALVMTGGSVALTGSGSQLSPNGPVTAAADAAGNPATVSGAGTLNLGGVTRTIIVNGPGFKSPAVADMVIASPIVGAAGAGLTKSGTGVLQLTNNETYGGTTAITQGVLLADAPGGATLGAVSLAGGTLGGTGTVGTIAPFSAGVSGTVQPGDGVGTPGALTSTPAGGTDTWNPATTLFLSIVDQGAGDFSTLAVNGNINLGGAQLAGFVGPGLNIGDTYKILTTQGGTITGRFAEPFGEVTPGGLGIAFVGGQKFTVDYSNPTQVVLKAVPQTVSVALSSGVSPSVFGQDVVFTATLTPEKGAGNVPGSDTVTFTLDIGSGLATFTALVVNNKATFDPLDFYKQPLSVGAHTIDATFNGDSKFASANATQLKQTVNQASTGVSLSNDPAGPIPAQPINVTATFSPVAPGAGVPSGFATFTLDGAPIPSNPVALNGAGQAVFSFTSATAGTHRVRVTYLGDTNFKPVQTNSDYLITVNKGTPTITITAVPLTSVYSQSVIFTTQVSGPVIPTGTVSFYKDTITAANLLGTLTLDGSGTASVTTAALAAGTHPVLVTYSGNSSYLNGQQSINFVVSKEQTSSALSSSAGTTAFGAAVTFSATVSPAAPGVATPMGLVTFYDGTSALGTSGLTTAGLATLSTNGLAVGSHTIKAVYAGNANFATSTSNSLTQVVQIGAQVTVSSTANPAFFGQTVTLTAKVKAMPPGTGTPADGETVNFYDGPAATGTLLAGNVPLTAGAASIVVSGLSTGPHTITVTYGGDAIFLGNSGTLAQSVVRANTTTTASTSLPPPQSSVYGQAVTFSATVVAKAPGAGTPTGNVNFYDGAILPGNLVGTGTLDGTGKTTAVVTTLGAVPHTVIAVYQSDTNFATSQASFTQLVIKDGTTTAVGPASNSSVYGQLVTFTATVAPKAPGGGTPTGLVTFLDTSTTKPTTLGTGTLSGGVATFSLSTLAVGTHTIAASYPGDSNFTGSGTTSTASLTVSQDATTQTVSSSLNPSVVGLAVTLTATVTANAPGSGVPGGTVTFLNNGVAFSPAINLSGGKATYVTTSLPQGVDPITVSYSGNSSFLGGTSSPPLQQTVLFADAVSITSSLDPATYGQAYTLTATVAPVGTTSVPTGKVDFLDGPITLAVVDLSTTGNVATATLTIPNSVPLLTAGTHFISIHYEGDANFTPNNTPKALGEVVTKDGSNTAVSASTNSTIYGLPVTLTATVNPNLAGSLGTPGGSVTFWDGAVNTGGKLGTATLSGGQATLVVTTLGAGGSSLLHNINASYSPDTNYTGSSSTSPAQVTVTQSTTQTTLTVPSPSVFGQTVTFTAVVSPGTGAGTPDGSVSFYDATTTPAKLLGTMNLVAGQATFATSILAVGNHQIQAVYSGSKNFSTSNDMQGLTVNQDATNVTVTPSVSPSAYLQTVTFTAKVTA